MSPAGAPAYRLPPPDGPFVEVPYRVYVLWVGQPYEDVVRCGGFPPDVLRRLSNPDEFIGHVSGWESHAAYCEANGTDVCPSGLAWLDVAGNAKLRFHSGTWNAPRRVGRRGRWRW